MATRDKYGNLTDEVCTKRFKKWIEHFKPGSSKRKYPPGKTHDWVYYSHHVLLQILAALADEQDLVEIDRGLHGGTRPSFKLSWNSKVSTLIPVWAEKMRKDHPNNGLWEMAQRDYDFFTQKFRCFVLLAYGQRGETLESRVSVVEGSNGLTTDYLRIAPLESCLVAAQSSHGTICFEEIPQPTFDLYKKLLL